MRSACVFAQRAYRLPECFAGGIEAPVLHVEAATPIANITRWMHRTAAAAAGGDAELIDRARQPRRWIRLIFVIRTHRGVEDKAELPTAER